jgi:hypothetical protein
LGLLPVIELTEGNVHNCLKLSDLNGIDRAGLQDEINVGCTIYLMVLMVSDFRVSRARSCMSVEGDICVEGKGPRCEDIVLQSKVFCRNYLEQIMVYFVLGCIIVKVKFFLLALSVKFL